MNRLSAFLLSVVILLSLSSYLQNNPPGNSKAFRWNKVYVVLLGDAAFDSALKNAFLKYWTVTPVAGFISEKEMDKKISDTLSSFFLTSMGHSVDHQRLRVNSDRICPSFTLISGGKKQSDQPDPASRQTVMSDMLDGYGNETDLRNSKYRLCLVVKSMNAGLLNDTTIKVSAGMLKDKILLINEKLLERHKGVKTVDGQALAVYRYKYEIASEEKIEALINAGDGKYALLVPALSDCTKYVVIYDLGTSRPLCGYYRKGTIFRFPWVRAEAFEQFNACAASKALITN